MVIWRKTTYTWNYKWEIHALFNATFCDYIKKGGSLQFFSYFWKLQLVKTMKNVSLLNLFELLYTYRLDSYIKYREIRWWNIEKSECEFIQMYDLKCTTVAIGWILSSIILLFYTDFLPVAMDTFDACNRNEYGDPLFLFQFFNSYKWFFHEMLKRKKWAMLN